MASEDEQTNEIQSVRKAFEVVEALDRAGGMTAIELARELDMARSTAHVYLNTLRNIGYVHREDGTYKLTHRFLKHGGHTRYQLDIYQAAKSEIDNLSQQTGEVADLGIEENGKRVLLYKSQGPKGITQKPVTGEYTHLHMTALGKALLSTMPEERIDEVVAEHGLPSATQHTITDKRALREEIERTRQRGYSLEDQERREGIRAIGMPIHDESGGAIGAISISGPASQLTDERIEAELVEQLNDTVNIIEIRHKNY